MEKSIYYHPKVESFPPHGGEFSTATPKPLDIFKIDVLTKSVH
jgi:hypothetical protein